MFVSHQWLSPQHPDPQGEQLQVLQKALTNLISGKTSVCMSPAIEMYIGRGHVPSTEDFQSQPLYIWYDYWSIPQGQDPEAIKNRELAISTIPRYVERSFFFVILCPEVSHENGTTLSYGSWESRGWCRMELAARELTRDDGYVIVLRDPSFPSLAWNHFGKGKAPGVGDFTFQEDRSRVAVVLQQMLWSKLQQLLENDPHNFRFLWHVHHMHLEGLESWRMEGLVPGFSTHVDPSSDPEGFVVARFLHDSLFKALRQRENGWSPLCYAATNGDAFLVGALLKQKADANDRLTKKKADLPRNLPVLAIAAAFKNNKVMQVLLAARAQVNARCGYGGTPLHYAAAFDNGAAVKILKDAKADIGIKLPPGLSALKVACAQNGPDAVKELLHHYPSFSLRYCLHTALLFDGDDRMVSSLIEAEADINEQLQVPFSRTQWWIFIKILSARHHFSKSSLTCLAHHHHGATPLMFSILAGKFACTKVLLQAGARLDIRNGRGKTAEDFLQEVEAPISFEDDTFFI
ncbi:unnamed protein product [Symbiodinium necroappetens]|uniref:Uncharacterized protein n=1 Tax=Symbiodinium necroappetens TaxID=1628268 RepID=A0A812S9Q4_9DINO|nr:unnamed protein product [Symbiodinium necroappetens]